MRESGSASSAINAASNVTTAAGYVATPLDESGDVMVIGPASSGAGTCSDPSCGHVTSSTISTGSTGSTGKLPHGAPEANTDSGSSSDAGVSSSPPKTGLPGITISPKLLVVLASLAGPVALALCATGIAAGVLHRRRKKREREEQQQLQKDAVPAAAQGRETTDGSANSVGTPSREDSLDGYVGSLNGASRPSKVRKRIQSTAGSNSCDGASAATTTAAAGDGVKGHGRVYTKKVSGKKKGHKVPGTPSTAQLEHSRKNSGAGSSGELGDNTLRHAVTEIEFLEPTETGSSDPGGIGSLQLHRKDSIELQLEQAAKPQHKTLRQSITGSIAGMAHGLANALRLSQTGAAYKVPSTQDRNTPALRSSLDLQPPMHAARKREPTLPGARRGSLDVPAAAAAGFAARASAIAAELHAVTAPAAPAASGGTTSISNAANI